MKTVREGLLVVTGALIGFMPVRALSNVIAYWDFSTGSHGIGDASGNGHYLINNGVTFDNGAAVFNGDKTLFTQDPLWLADRTNLTIEAFVKTTVTSSTMVLFELSDNYNSQWGAFVSYIDGGQLWGMFNAYGAPNGDRTETGAYADGQWHHMAIVIHAATGGAGVADLYLDGVKQIDAYVDGVSGNCINATFFIGSRANSQFKFVGELDDLRISDQALTTNEFLKVRSAELPPANVIAYWPFAPGSELADASGHGNALSNDGVTFARGAAVFNGMQSVFSTASSLDLTTYSNITIEAFVKSSSTSANIVFEHGYNWNNSSGGILTYFGDPAAGQFFAGYRAAGEGGYNYDNSAPGVISDGRWHHFALTIDLTKTGGEIANLYIDGWKQYEAEGYSAVSGFLNTMFFIGSRANSVAKLTGELDDLRISDRVLAPWEFLQSRTVAPPDLIAYWSFHPGQETQDDSGNGHTLANNGVTFYNGAAVFDGHQSSFSTVDWLNLSSFPAVTIETFIKSSSTNLAVVLEHSQNFNERVGGFALSFNDPTFGFSQLGKLVSGFRTYDGYTFEGSEFGPLSDGKWHHVATVYTPHTNRTEAVKLYIDGVRQTEISNFHGEWVDRFADAFFYIGARTNASYRFEGMLDDVRITGRALSPSEFETERTKTLGTLLSIQ